MALWRGKWLTHALFALAFAAGAGACSPSSGGGAACATLCGTTPDCAGTSCLAYCLEVQVACSRSTTQGAATAFPDWAACSPTLLCVGGQYTQSPDECTLPQIELLSCASGVIASFDAGHFTLSDAGVDVHVAPPPEDAGKEAGDASCGSCLASCTNDCGQVCTGGACATCTSDGSCSASCVDNCGAACSGGDCCTSDGTCSETCVDNCGTACTGGDCCTSDGDCGSDCEDNCGNACTGGSCCTPDGECGTDCEDNCGNACTGGSCTTCVSTGCSDCDADCDDGDACSDNCGNDCCSE